MTEKKEIIETKPGQVASVDQMLVHAMDKQVPIDTIERLMLLREQMVKEQAKKDFYHALSAFQGDCPPIKKTREVKNKDKVSVRYKYANLDDIVEQVSPLLQQYGLSYITRTGEPGETVKATIISTHVNGHSEETSFWVPIEKDAYMNDQQKVKSANTFAMRVAFCNAFGITTADDDDDAQTAGQGPTALDIYKKLSAHAEAIRNHWASVAAIRDGIAINDLSLAAEAYYELSQDVQSALHVAPSKGGIFTTEEREIMKSTEFKEAYYGPPK